MTNEEKYSFQVEWEQTHVDTSFCGGRENEDRRSWSERRRRGLPLEWADAVWEHKFCESVFCVSVSLPAEASEVLSAGAWEAAVAVCRQWTSRREESGESKQYVSCTVQALM